MDTRANATGAAAGRRAGAVMPLARAAHARAQRYSWSTAVLDWIATMRARHVLAVLDALSAAGLRAWVAGGWGVDALVGRRTRRHADLDLVIATADEPAALAILGRLGYRPYLRLNVPDALLPERVVVATRTERAVDLHPVDVAAWIERTSYHPFTTGSIKGRPVACLTAAAQRDAHSGYELRAQDHHDLAVLREHPPPA